MLSIGDLANLASEYIEWDPNEETVLEMNQLKSSNDGSLRALLTRRLEFGTAGLRGPMGAGYNRMNELTVIQTTQGLAAYLERTWGESTARSMGIAIGYDHRRHGSLTSEGFAMVAAGVLVARGFKVYLLVGAYVATPLVPFCVDAKKCAAGVMITASHNPKGDNGYKVYWSNGSQIIPPHDTGIAECILENLAPWPRVSDQAGILSSPLCENPLDEIAASYFARVGSSLCRYREENARVPPVGGLQVVYTAMHGVGRRWTSASFEAFSLPPYRLVAEQCEPDAEFPSVPFPNPEERGALDLGKAVGDALLADPEEASSVLLLANDPDADRLAAAERLAGGEGAAWVQFTGNEIGALLGHWQWSEWWRRNPEGDAGRVAMLASTVSSKMLAAMARAEGFHFEETLTGFKWMGSRTTELREQGYEVLFSFEEAIGFCLGDVVCDKDGVAAAAVFAEMAHALRRRNSSVSAHLQSLYERYGHFVDNNHYVFVHDPETVTRIFERLRNGGEYWESCAGYGIQSIRDLTTGFDSAAPDKRASLPASPSTQMITYTFANRCVATLRTSGTEPKLKYYVEMPGAAGVDRATAQADLNTMVSRVLSEFLQPEANGLELL